MTKIAVRFALWILVAALAAAGLALAEPAARSAETQAEIDFLLERVADSGYVFVRNGEEHGSAEAAAHMRRKYEHFDDEILTTEDFIERSATRSLITRRAYEVRFPDGTQMETARWLRDELAAYRAERDGHAAAQDG
jgi:hypothetical protein